MIRKTFLCVSVLIIFSSFSFAQWIPLEKNSLPGTKPDVQLISSDATGAVIKVDLPGFYLKEFSSNGEKYQSISFGEDAAITTEVGSPELPLIAKILAIPDQGTVNVEVIQTSTIQTFKGINVPPARESWIEGDPETPYVQNTEVYKSGNIFPQNFASVEDPVVFRDFRLARVSVYPLRYSPSTKVIEAVSSITVRVTYGTGIGINPKLTQQRPIAPSFDKLYKSTIFNYDEVLQRRYNSMVTGHDIMLCIMPDIYEDEFQPYADWKNESGTEVYVTKFSEIGANQNDPDIIKNYILSVYNSWENIPTHILIVGDKGTPAGNAPVKYWTGDGWTFVNEDYFVELEGNDYFPEMMIGRFTNYNGATGGGEYILQVMVDKFLKYEKYPYTANTDWYKKATVCSNNNYQSQVDTKRFAAQQMLVNGHFTSVDTMMSNWQCTYDENDIVAAINNGRSFLNYRGEGWYDGWHANCYYFTSSYVNSINNANKLTFVTSIGCGVAAFDQGDCFGETWIEKGSLTSAPTGACAFLGPTSNTHTQYNNQIDKGIYLGMFPPDIGILQEGIDSPGEALLRGKLYMYQQFGGTDPYVQYHFKIYCVLGDPSMHIWKDVPEAVTVTHPSEIYVGFNQVPFEVNNASNGLPVSNARICISGNGVYATGKTDDNGITILDIEPGSVGTLKLTVTGGNVIPFEDSIIVSIGTENITPYGNPVVTDLDGNDDGLINPNENASITFTLKNWGTITSNEVYAKLSVPDSVTYVVMVTDSILFGNIAPNDSIVGSPFKFFIKPECPVGYVIRFKLNVESSTSSWDYTNNQLVHGCNLNFDEYYVDDEGSVLHNYRMDPGETVKVRFKLLNIGDDIAPDVKGIISTEDPYLTVIDSVATFGNILADSNSTNESDTYTITVNENCPLQHEGNFELKLLTQNGLYPYSLIDSIILPVAMPSVSDPTGSDSTGYYAYSNLDTLWEQAPEYNWIDLEGIGTKIPLSNAGNFTKEVNPQFNFKYSGNNFSQVRISSDGWIAFGSGNQVADTNHVLPYLDGINDLTAVFWDDLFYFNDGPGGELLYYFDPQNHRFIVEWNNVPHRADTTDRETFEVILLDPAYYPTQTGDGEIIFQYMHVEEPGGCTVGIENGTEDIGLQYVFNELYDPTANELVDGLAIKFTTKAPSVVSVGENGNQSGGTLPTAYSLEQNYPNPFNPATRINYAIPEPGFVKLSIYDINGSLVKTLIDKQQSAGRYQVIWDGDNQSGSKVSTGVYFYRLQANSFVQVRKMILLK